MAVLAKGARDTGKAWKGGDGDPFAAVAEMRQAVDGMAANEWGHEP